MIAFTDPARDAAVKEARGAVPSMWSVWSQSLVAEPRRAGLKSDAQVKPDVPKVGDKVRAAGDKATGPGNVACFDIGLADRGCAVVNPAGRDYAGGKVVPGTLAIAVPVESRADYDPAKSDHRNSVSVQLGYVRC